MIRVTVEKIDNGYLTTTQEDIGWSTHVAKQHYTDLRDFFLKLANKYGNKETKNGTA